MRTRAISRRSLLAQAGAAAIAAAATKKEHLPIGLELYSVRDQLKQDLMGTVRGVAKMGYEDVEFYSPYFEWTTAYAKDVRKLLDDLGIRCLSTHNGSESFTADRLPHAIELNQILGSKYVVMASAGKVENLDGWKGGADKLNQAEEKLKPLCLHPSFHTPATSFRPMGGKRPMDVLAANTSKDVVLQLDVGTCVEAGSDPVAWINANP